MLKRMTQNFGINFFLPLTTAVAYTGISDALKSKQGQVVTKQPPLNPEKKVADSEESKQIFQFP